MNEQITVSQSLEHNPLHQGAVDIIPGHVDFARVNAFLSEYFSTKGEYESEQTIRARFTQPFDTNAMQAKFFMKAIFDGESVIGARIHQVVVPPEDASEDVPVIVFLMNILVSDTCRNNGAGKLLRQAAKDDVVGLTKDTAHERRQVLYIAEMEPLESDDPDSASRYKAYTKSGFRLISPDHVKYKQLDDPKSNKGREMSLLVAKDLNHHVWEEETSISKVDLEQVVAALKYSYTAVGYTYDDETEPVIFNGSTSCETRALM